MIAILQRELIAGMRRGAPFALLAWNAAALASLAALVGALAGTISPWLAPSIGATVPPTPSGLGATLIAWRGSSLFFVLTVWLALLATLIAPLAGARTLIVERTNQTMDQLVGSGVSPWGIVLGKAIGALAQVGLVLVSGAPAFALVWLFGGVRLRTVLVAAGLLFVFSAALVVLGMLAGALLHGETAPLALAGSAGVLLVVITVGVAAYALVAGSGATLMLALTSPLLGLLVANPDFAEAVARVTPGVPPAVLRSGFGLPGPMTAVAPPVLTGVFYGLLTLILLPGVAIALDPYHRLKTLGLRSRPGADR